MKKNNLIICDSGIRDNQLEYCNYMDIGFGYTDTNGHGSQAVDTIKTILPNANITSIKILNSKNEGNLEGLYNALIECLSMDSLFICLPLSIDINHIKEIKDVIDELSESGKIIISALDNKKRISIPAKYQNVIGVCGHRKGRFYRENKKIQVSFNYSPIICRSIDSGYSIYSGNSCACALFTAHIMHVSHILGTNSKSEIESFISGQTYEKSLFHSWVKHPDIYRKNESNYKSTRALLSSVCKEHMINPKNIINSVQGLQGLTCFIYELEAKGYNINRKSFLTLQSIKNIDNLTQYLIHQNNGEI